MEEGVTVINGDRQSRTNSPRDDSPRTRSTSPKKEEQKRFLNGWSKEQERLMSEWSDMAMCYRWIHDKSEKIFHAKSMWINLPVIILTTLGGTANFGIQSVFTTDSAKQYASFAIGGISLFAGLLTTIGNYLRYAQLEESHRVASIAWGKFQRLIAIELALNPNERMDSLDFLKICRADLDRLIEQSPPIPQEAVSLFEERFSEVPNLKKPDICGALEHTHVFESSETRLKQVAVDAAIMLKQRRNMLTELTMPKIQERIDSQIDTKLENALKERKKHLEMEIELEKLKSQQTKEEYDKVMEERHKRIQEEIELEKKKIPVNNSRFESRLSLKRTILPLAMRQKPKIENTIIFSPRPNVSETTEIPHNIDTQQKSIESFAMNESPEITIISEK